MLFLMFINLYTSRIVLKNLGVEDYGIYNAVGGFITMFSMISSALSTAISRYLTYTIGENNHEKLKRVFSTSIIIQLVLCIILILLIESLGVWFLNSKMTIPEARLFAANFVLQFSLITFVINLLSIPYNAVLIAHERMNAFAYIGIYEGIVTLAIAFLLKVSPLDSLIYYSFLMFLLAFSTRLIYGMYCKRHFDECNFKWIFDGILFKDMMGFAGWNFIGVSSGVLRSQGINILFNVYLGPIVNAARGLAMQILNAVNKFSGSFYTAVQPQITKYYAAGEYAAANKLVCQSSRLSFFLMLIFCLPIIWETDFLLSLWLIDVPQYTVQLTRIVLLFALSEAFSQPLIYLMLATGKIKTYQIVVGCLGLLNFPLAWLLLYSDYSVVVVQSTTILFSWLSLFLRLYMLNQMVKFSIACFVKETLGRSLFVFVISSMVPLLIVFVMESGYLRFLINVSLTILSLIITIVYWGLKSQERVFVLSKVKAIIKKI